MKGTLTARQKYFYKTICQFIADHGYSPTFRDIMKLTDIASPNGIRCNLAALRKKRYLPNDEDGLARMIIQFEILQATKDAATKLLSEFPQGEKVETHRKPGRAAARS